MGEWSRWGHCRCNEGTCGSCNMIRVQEVVQNCANGGDCNCIRSEETADCSKPCRKLILYI